MAKKATYKELEQKVKALEKALAKSKQTEKNLRENTSMLGDILEKAADGICVCHNISEEPFVRFTHWNPRMTAITGYTMEEINQLGWYQTMYPDLEVQKRAIERMTRMRAGDDILAEEWVITPKSGEKKPLSISTSIVKEEDGRVHVLAVIQDISSRKQVEEALRESEGRFKTLFEESTEAQLLLDHEGKVIDCNAAFLQLFALQDKAEVMGHIAGDFAPEFQPNGTPSRERGREVLKTVMARGSARYEWAHFKHDLSRTPIITELMCTLLSITGQPMLHVAIRDITERKRAEQALLESEEKYRLLVANANDAIFIAQDGFIKFPNPITLALTGYSEKELTTLPFINLIHSEDRVIVMNNYSRRLKGEEVPSTYSFRIINKHGEERWGQINAVLITWEGRPAVLSFMRDITSQKKLEAQYMHAQKMEAVGTLAGGVAHDFNNLLQTILGYSEILLMNKEKGDMDYQPLLEINRAAQRSAELTHQLLTFSRKVESKLRPVNLTLEVRQIKQLLKRTIPKMIELELAMTEDLQMINADPVQVEQVLMNLAINARDAMPEGGRLTIGTQNIFLDKEFCRVHLGAKPGEYVLLTISDTGYGMEKEVLTHLFEPFYTTKKAGKGTGLGLSMVYGIVKGHGGYIKCESEVEKGTTFKIYWPVIEQVKEEQRVNEKGKLKGGTETILLVDDEESIQELGKEIFSRFGYTILIASNGNEALEIYRRERDRIDLIILDLILPGMGGKKCLEGLLNINHDAKVVIATGYFPDEAMKGDLEPVVKRFISKPYNMKEILQVIREVLDSKTLEGGSGVYR